MVIFVTALYNLNETRDDRGLNMRLAMFEKLVATGIYLYVFIDPIYADVVHVPNGVIVPIDFNSLDAYKLAPEGISAIRNENKDTREFMILMNAKIEFVKLCMDSTTATHYAWIDFSIYNVLTDPISTERLHNMQLREFPKQCAYFPGIWNPLVVWNHINWRFCGGFFLGDRETLYEMYQLHLRLYPTIPNLTWEVNVWAYLEQEGMIFDWFLANHDDSILAIP